MNLYQVVWVPLIAYTAERLLHPLDNIISVQQKIHKGPLAAILWIHSRHGLPGFYAGLIEPLLIFGVARVAMISCYFQCKTHWMNKGIAWQAAVFGAGFLAASIDAIGTLRPEYYRTCKIFQIPLPSKITNYLKSFIPLWIRCVVGVFTILAASDLIVQKRLLGEFSHPFLAGLLTGSLSQWFIIPIDYWKTLWMIPNDQRGNQRKWQHIYLGISAKMLRMGLGSGVVIAVIFALS